MEIELNPGYAMAVAARAKLTLTFMAPGEVSPAGAIVIPPPAPAATPAPTVAAMESLPDHALVTFTKV